MLVRLGAREEGLPDPPVRVTLCLGMLKAAKFEVALQKCTELGVAAFVPLLTERAVRDEVSEAKRGAGVASSAEAVEQCGGSHLPELVAPQSLSQALSDLPPGWHRALPLGGDTRAIVARRAGGGGRRRLASISASARSASSSGQRAASRPARRR